ncbi:hypothetical protein EDB19DRAFT_1778119 [Suillus lakei]|nr:hypothetical protein EDB19DRAFT_1778119 [Suillus lakei]
MALSHLYCGRVLQAYPDRGEFLGRGRRDYDVFLKMSLRGVDTSIRMVLATTMQLCLPEDDNRGFLGYKFLLEECPDSVLEWLSHSLPYHFVTGRVDAEVEEFAAAVISKLISSPSSPSTQIVANCTFLACVMVGVQVDKKDMVRIDKSSALPRFADALLAQFQVVLWTCDGGDFDKDSPGVARRAWKLLDVICPMLESAERYYSSSFHTMQNLDVCRKIYSRARSSEQNHPWEMLDALQNALRFTLTAAKVSRDPVHLWYDPFAWTRDSHSPEDFDWLVDYLDYIYSDDHEAACDILLLLRVMEVRCSPAKQHQFIESLIACMNKMASIDTIDDTSLRDMVLTKFLPAILSAVRPQPGATSADDDPDRFFHRDRDLCYLELVFALARNPNWHPHLCGDSHIDRCISIIANCLGSHAFYLAGILLRIAPDHTSVTSLDSITERQWWDVTSNAWFIAYHIIDDIHYFDILPVLVEGTKKYMQIASERDLEELIRNVDRVLQALEGRDSEQGEGEGVTIAVKELRTVASDMLQKLVDSK